MMANKDKTDFTQSFSDESAEAQAYQELLDYLIATGRYPDATQADNDAIVRVQFCQEMDLYANDTHLKDASDLQRKIHTLIHSNNLHHVIAANGGYLPVSNKTESVAHSLDAEDDEVLPALYPDPDHEPGNNFYDVHIDHGRLDDDIATVEPTNETAVPAKENIFLHLIRHLTTAFGLVALLLTASRFFLDSDDLLQITKYGLLLFIVLLLIVVALAEVSGRLMTRLRYVFSYSFLLATATLSGLLFLQQQPWADTTLHLRGGTIETVINFIIHRALVIGPFWLGIFFAVTALILLITTWFAGRNINND